MRMAALAATVLLITGIGCDSSETSDGAPCGGSTCGYLDIHYDSTFYCPPAPLRPGGWYGFTWHDAQHCHEECNAAASSGCDASGCDEGCETTGGSGDWLPCSTANGGVVTPDGCWMEGSGWNGETVDCVCR